MGQLFSKLSSQFPCFRFLLPLIAKKNIYIYIYIKGSYSLSRNKGRELDHIQPIQIDLAKLLSKT